MRLILTLPARVEIDQQVDKVVAEAIDGHFGILPRHVDMVTLLAPGILSYTSDGVEHFVAIDGGLLAKIGDQVQVATTSCAGGVGLDELRRVVEESYQRVEESELAARAALTRLETDLVRRLVQLEEMGRG